MLGPVSTTVSSPVDEQRVAPVEMDETVRILEQTTHCELAQLTHRERTNDSGCRKIESAFLSVFFQTDLYKKYTKPHNKAHPNPVSFSWSGDHLVGLEGVRVLHLLATRLLAAAG